MILAELGKSYNNAILSVSQTLLLERRTRRTFTIDPDVSEKIDKLVGGHNLEVNVLVNKSIRRYIVWGRYVDIFLYYFRTFDLASVLKTFELIGAEYANAYAYTEFGDKDSRTIILRHSMGRSASAYYGASFKALCDRLGVTVELEESDDRLICKIGGASSLKIMAPKTFKEQLAKQAVERRVEP